MRKYFFKNFIFLSKTDNYHRIHPFFYPIRRFSHHFLLNQAPETCHRLVIEQFERKLESHRIKLPVDGAYKGTHIEDMRTDAVTQLHVRIQVRHEEHTAIKALLLNHPQPSV